MAKDFLDAFDELNSTLSNGGDVLLDLAVDLVDEDPDQPRENFDPVELEALAQTIAARGLLQPIKVKPAAADGRYRIRFGARRFRAAKLAGLTTIKALIAGGPLSQVDRLVEQVVENDQREPLSTAERARTVARLLELGETQTSISRLLGRPKDQIAMLAAVRTMPEPIKVLAAQLGVRTLYELSSAWKIDGPGVEHWLRDRDPQTITQALARGLALRAAETDRVAVIDGKRAAAPPAPRPAPTRPAPGAVPVEIEVEVNGRFGVLLLVPGEDAQVRFGRDRPVAAPFDQLRIVAMRRP
jgi:ParB family chromosome partitioning protein